MNPARIYHFSDHGSFVGQLAEWLLLQHSDEPMQLARSLILLPSRRACRSLREACLQVSDGKPLLLPRIMPIGEASEELDIMALCPQEGNELPIMPEQKRLAILTRLIMKAEDLSPARAYQLATDLAALLDEATRYQLNFDELTTLVKEKELASHWQQTTEFLKLITSAWPKILEDEQRQDASSASYQRIMTLAEHWRNNPPDFPVIAAGSTASNPTTAQLLLSIATMPLGTVILPGLDMHMPEEAWTLLEPTHPHYGLKQFLHKAGIHRDEVRPFSPSITENLTLRAIFSPAPLTAHWSELALDIARDLGHCQRMEAATQLDEARMITYHLRKTLESPGKTAALVTPDRHLARMVASHCAYYGIIIDDSAGIPLANSPAAIFMQLVLDVALHGASPASLLALLRHPFTAIGNEPATCREASRLIEIECLRGVRLMPGMDALRADIMQAALPEASKEMMSRLADILRPLELLFLKNEPTDLDFLMALHCEIAEAIATTATEEGRTILWAKEEGNQLADTISSWRQNAEALGYIHPHDYPALFKTFLSQNVVRKAYGTHPRLHILSPMEARLTHYDLMILGEMNEDSWPASISIDPWMSHEMRGDFGLPPHAMQIGQSAHDIWMLMQAPHVLLTRAEKIGGTETQPSRWWVRMTTLLQGKNPAFLQQIDISANMRATLDELYPPANLEAITAPAPIPPLAARPIHFRATEIDAWQKDAYAFYARKILDLKALAPLDQDPDAAEFGTIAHQLCEEFCLQYPTALPEHAYQHMLNIIADILVPYKQHPAVMALWWPRLEAIARQWLAFEAELRQSGNYHTHTEVRARWTYEDDEITCHVHARADRVDEMHDGFRLIDYKTGTAPRAKQIEDGSATQLPLTALALIHGGALSSPPKEFAYWQLKTNDTPYHSTTQTESVLKATHEQFISMVKESLTSLTAYAAPITEEKKNYVDDYAHLTRRSEWGGG